MSRISTFAIVAAIAAALTMVQPRPAEAGSAGGFVAGIALGVIGAALVHRHHRAYASPHGYYQPNYYAPYYAPPRVYVHQHHHRHNYRRW